MISAFVIHAHRGWGQEHYDLMIQQGQALATWQVAIPPDRWRAGEPIAAGKLPDHRIEYLTYEGPVSKGRGSVQRIDRGDCRILQLQEGRWEVEFQGEVVRGRFEIRRLESGNSPEPWQLAIVSPAQ